MFIPTNVEKEILDIIKEARRKNIFLFLEDGKLKCRMAVTPPPDRRLLDKLIKYKTEIKNLISTRLDNSEMSDWTKISHGRAHMRRIPLSFSQERLWVIDRMEGSAHYHIPWVLRLKGPLNKEAIEAAFKDIVNRHEVLRTVFHDKDGMNYQEVMAAGSWSMKRIRARQYAEDPQGLASLISSLVDAPFDLSQDHMLRVHLIDDISWNEQILIINVHHIASDGWSWAILVRELMALYAFHAFGIEPGLPPLQVQYADFAIWQRQYLQGTVLDGKLDYWRRKLSGVTPLPLPLDYVRPPEHSTLGGSIQVWLEAPLAKGIKDLSHANGVTLFMTMLATFKILLYRYSGQEDVCVGTPIAGRTQQETEDVIGFFINTLALRTDLGGNPSFREVLQSVKQTTLEAYEHQDVPFAKVVEEVVKERDLVISPLFQVMFVMQNTPDTKELQLGEDISLSYETPSLSRTKFDLTVTVFESNEGLGLYTEYCVELFNRSTIERMMRHYKELLRAMLISPDAAIRDLKMLTQVEKKQVLKDFNDTAVSYPADKTLVDLLLEQCARTPDRIAVVFEETEINYRELDERSNQLAHYLRGRGVKEETLVPICIDRSLEMIVGILGIMKAGGAYVPIDPEYPAERISYMLSDLSAHILLSRASPWISIPDDFPGEVLLLDEDWTLIAAHPITPPPTSLKANNLAYVIYTSGSTGKPKGVMNQHDGIVNRLLWAQEHYHLTVEDTVLQKTTFCFDVSVWELLWPLLVGSKLVFANPKEHKDPRYLKYIIRYRSISCIHFVPSMLELFLSDLEKDECTSLKKVLCSGEALKPSQVALFREKLPGVQLHNLYGPTEAAIDVTWWDMNCTDNTPSVVPIGKPVANTSIYITGSGHSPVPIGVIGEIYIGGIQVARGYINRPELTAERFIPDPFSDQPGRKIYRTGDLGRWLPDGNIEYVGRIDDQVKIRGYRIELGEIESMVYQSGLIKQCVVIADKDTAGNSRLVGYVMADAGFERKPLITWLQHHLPDYMVPRLWVTLESIPLTSNGKVDKRSLPKADAGGMQETAYVAPRNKMEVDMVEICKEVLGIEQIGIHDDFFLLGGQSLMVIRIVHFARQRNYHLLYKHVFQYSTIAKLSDHYLQQIKATETTPAEKEIAPPSGTRHPQVIALNDCDDGLPLFILPGSPGFCIPYEELGAALGNTYKVYGVQMPGLREGERKIYDLEEIAALCIQWIKEVQPEGPYRFIGHSFGGYIAFDMTKKLEHENEKVEFVCFLDILADACKYVVSTAENILRNICDFLMQADMLGEQYPDWAEELQSLIQDRDEENQVPFVINFVKNKVPAVKKNDAFMWMVMETVIIQSKMRYYPSGKLNAGFLVVKAQDAPGVREGYMGWEFYTDDITEFYTPGDHTSIIKSGNARVLASKIKSVMAGTGEAAQIIENISR